MERTLPLMLRWDENFDVGADTGTPGRQDYQVPFKFTGKLVKLTLSINQPAGTLGGGQEAAIGSPAQQQDERVAAPRNPGSPVRTGLSAKRADERRGYMGDRSRSAEISRGEELAV